MFLITARKEFWFRQEKCLMRIKRRKSICFLHFLNKEQLAEHYFVSFPFTQSNFFLFFVDSKNISTIYFMHMHTQKIIHIY